MDFLELEKRNSSDFWRQVAGAVVANKQLICYAYNTHRPDQENPYYYGDPRFNFSRGVEIDLSTAEHAERKLISICAREGWAVKGASLYVTTFPCPGCAKAIASAGFAECFFRDGYSILDAEIVLKEANVKLIQVK
jgi:dCMP deaminase